MDLNLFQRCTFLKVLGKVLPIPGCRVFETFRGSDSCGCLFVLASVCRVWPASDQTQPCIMAMPTVSSGVQSY